ncbi:glycoside hydrolase family 43 protein [Streptomyces sp. NPDC127049]|uniref:glycoside hydrolase family 43 protein n=1 Tax=Streptomyces sp. NPDC127049 TaxID=3347118 RepID=UPI003663F7AE
MTSGPVLGIPVPLPGPVPEPLRPTTPDDRDDPVLVNPVLPGFHPDPSILRVGDDYYIATSTFEWTPGVTLHHSRDLVHWTPLGGLLQEDRLLDLAGRPDSGGVWAPCLSHTDGLFHLVYSDVTNLAGAFKDVRNRVTTAPSLAGPWSDPVPFPSHGFDPSLFHDDGPDGDGRSWAVWMEWDHRPGRNPFAGILLQEWDRARSTVTGPEHRVFTGTALAHTEGPHLYRRGRYHYLVTAEGGTSWDHAVTVARSRSLTGPYEADPAGPLLTSRHHPEAPLQKAGHGSLVETPSGEWYLAHLTARPLTPRGACVLGRETALQRVEWTPDGWPRLAGATPVPGGETLPRTVVRAPAPAAARPSPPALAPVPPPVSQAPTPAVPVPPPPSPATAPASPGGTEQVVSADSARLVPPWSALRRHPDPGWLAPLPGGVRLYGGQSLGSTHGQSLVARRRQAADGDFSVRLDFRPGSPLAMAGLVHYYNTTLWHYAHLTWDEELGRVLRLGVCEHGRYGEPAAPLPVGDGPVELRLAVRGAEGRFSWRQGGRDARDGRAVERDGDARWRPLGQALDVSPLSDEGATRGDPETGHYTAWGFTGAFAGLCAQDLTGGRAPADFTRPVHREWA